MIVFKGGVGENFVVNLVDDKVTLGRHPANLVVVADRSIAPFHADFQHHKESGQYQLRDLGSYRGTWVNGVEVSESFLQDGDVIRLGAWEGRFEDLSRARVSAGASEEGSSLENRVGNVSADPVEFLVLESHRLGAEMRWLKSVVSGLDKIREERGRACEEETERLIALQKERKTAQVEKADMEAQLDARLSDLQRYRGELTAVENRLNEGKVEREVLQGELARLKSTYQQGVVDEETAHQRRIEERVSFAGERAEFEKVQGEREVLVRELFELRKCRDDLESEARSMVQEIEGRRKVLTAELVEVQRVVEIRDGLKRELVGLQEKKHQVTVENQQVLLEMKETHTVIAAELQLVKSQLSEARVALDKLAADKLEVLAEQKKREGLRREVESLDRERDGLRAEVEECRQAQAELMGIRETRASVAEARGDEAGTHFLFVQDLMSRLDLLATLWEHSRLRPETGWIEPQLKGLKAAFLDLLAVYGFEDYDVPVGTLLDIDVRRRIRIVETRNEKEKANQVLEVIRPGFTYRGEGGLSVVFRKAEIIVSSISV